ncbi:conserved Plasmodium protein, unknown function [Plasmodium malariae]|uniref:Uncharacterized protein n=1 Tax=Plasmodium malariae TaxID=5858 RepID=A0A1C3KZ00_PLAMA|nr:conserved Plasmodium protein, unknown function [Plasmodium malariae]
MYFTKEKKDNEEEIKRNVGSKNLPSHKNKKYVRNLKQSMYNNKYINKFNKRNNDLKVRQGNNGVVFNNTLLNTNNLKIENNKNNQVYFNKNVINRNNKENTRSTNTYKKTYFDQDNINYNSLINSQVSVCSIHIEKTDDDIKNQIKFNEQQLLYLCNNRTHTNETSSHHKFPLFVEEINFTENLVLLTGILILSNNDKIFNNLEFEGKTNPLPNDCNLSIYVNVVNRYDSQYFKQLYPASYNFKNRLFFVTLNESTVDSSLLIDKIIVKGSFQTLSLIVLGQSEEISEQLKYYREIAYDKNLRSNINEETLDVENIDLEKDDIFVPKKPVDIKTYNINTLMEEKLVFRSTKCQNYLHKDFLSVEDANNELYELSNVLEKEFIKNNLHQMSNSNSDSGVKNEKEEKEKEKEEEEEETDNAKISDETAARNNGNNVTQQERDAGKVEANEHVQNEYAPHERAHNEMVEQNQTNKQKGKVQFIPPNNDLIINILNAFTEQYKNKKEIGKNDIPIYKKIIKYGAMWMFYIFKNIKKDEDDFYINYSNYTEIKVYDILGCLLILRRCALYPNLAKYIAHMNFDAHILYLDPLSPHVLINLIDILYVNNIYFFSSWKIKTSILKTLIALISDSYVMNLFCNYVS